MRLDIFLPSLSMSTEYIPPQTKRKTSNDLICYQEKNSSNEFYVQYDNVNVNYTSEEPF